MHIERFLHKMLSPVMHLKRLTTLSIFVLAAIKGKKLSLTNLGRSADLNIQERSAIRRADRFLENKHLYCEREDISRAVICKIMGNVPQPKIIVDWSAIPNTKNHVLRAAVMTIGRALTIYDEVHPEEKLGKKAVHKRFLIKLKSLLPENCIPTIVTDAGFHNDWFSDVRDLGWHYLGRIRSGKNYTFGNDRWHSMSTLLKEGIKEPEYIGNVILCRSNPIKTNLYRVKNPPKGRKYLNKNKKERKDKKAKEYSKSAKEAWVIATSLPHKKFLSANRVIKIYKNRMQIEEGFRDLKSHKFGFSLVEAHSIKIKRIEILLLIALLASFIAWLVGYVGESKKLQYQFQANSIKHHRVLSLFFLGCQMIKRKINITLGELENMFLKIKSCELINI